MQKINLPDFDVRISGTKEHPKILDTLRRRYVALTPEEWVRQHFTHYLIEHKGYPSALLANEVELQIGGKTLRADSILYARDFSPRMIIEYKAPTVAVTQSVFDQIFAYNALLHASHIVVSNGMKHYCCKIDYDSNSYTFLKDIPNYDEL